MFGFNPQSMSEPSAVAIKQANPGFGSRMQTMGPSILGGLASAYGDPEINGMGGGMPPRQQMQMPRPAPINVMAGNLPTETNNRGINTGPTPTGTGPGGMNMGNVMGPQSVPGMGGGMNGGQGGSLWDMYNKMAGAGSLFGGQQRNQPRQPRF